MSDLSANFSPFSDVIEILKRMKEKDNEAYREYIEKKIPFSNTNFPDFVFPDVPDQCITKLLLLERWQEIVNKFLDRELPIIDKANIPVIGLKGCFVSSAYWPKSVTRFYSDLDLIVDKKSSYLFYSKLKKNGYHFSQRHSLSNRSWIQKFYFVFISHVEKIAFFTLRSFFVGNTHSISVRRNDEDVEIDLLSTLRERNMGAFNIAELFERSSKYENYENIYVLDPYDNISYLSFHLVKHLAFGGINRSGNKGIAINMKGIIDIALIINSINNFDETILLERAMNFEVVQHTIYCLNLYNLIFRTGKQVKLEKFLEVSKGLKCSWEQILCHSLQMDPIDILMGNYGDYFHQAKGLPRSYRR